MATAELSRASLPALVEPPLGHLTEECQREPVRLAFRFGPAEGPELSDYVRGSALAWRETVATMSRFGHRLELVETRRANTADVWMGTAQTLEQEFTKHGSTEQKTFLVLDAPHRDSVLGDDHRCFWIGAGPQRRIDTLAAWLAVRHGTRTWYASGASRNQSPLAADTAPLESADVLLLSTLGDDDLPALLDLRHQRPHLWIALAATPKEPRTVLSTLRDRVVWAEDWHPHLCDSGAKELNTRYAVTFDHSMTSAAWRAWLGVKCVAQAARSSALNELSSALVYTDLDGCKGIGLSFDKDRTLTYPLCVVGREEREQPVLSSVMP